MISIVTCVLNRELEIRRMIESVLSQTYNNYELVIVDNGSTDNTVSIINEFKSKKIKLLHCAEKGISFARNMAIINAKFNTIHVLDSDNYFIDSSSLHKLATITDKLKNWDLIFTQSFLNGKCAALNIINGNKFLKVKDYLNIRGECTPTFKKDWFVAAGMYPEIKGCITEFPMIPCYYAVESGRAFLSMDFIQIYSDDAASRVSSRKFINKTSIRDMCIYYDLILYKHGNSIKDTSLISYIVFIIKSAIYYRICEKGVYLYLINRKFISKILIIFPKSIIVYILSVIYRKS